MKFQNKNKLLSVLSLILCALLIFAQAGCQKKQKETKDPTSVVIDKEQGGGEESVNSEEGEEDSSLAMWSSTTTVSGSMFTYYFNEYYRSFVGENINSLNQMRLDPALPLADQPYGNGSWYDRILELTVKEITEIIHYTDGAKSADMKLDENDLGYIENTINSYGKAAKEAGVTLNEYLKTVFGANVNSVTMEKCLRQQLLADKYYKSQFDGVAVTPEECEQYAVSNPGKILYYDALQMSVSRDKAGLLSKCTTEEEFTAAMTSILTEKNFGGEYDRFAHIIDPYIASKKLVRNSVSTANPVSIWASNENRRPYQTYVGEASQNSEYVSVAMVLPASAENPITTDNGIMYRDSAPVISYKYCIISDSTKAQGIYDTWVKAGAAESDLDVLIAKNLGSEAEYADKGDIAAAEVSSWLHAPERTLWDYSLINVEDVGSYIVLVKAIGDISWYHDCRSAIISEKLAPVLAKLEQSHPIKENENKYKPLEIKISVK